jgi:VWFA-related protein
VPGLRRAKVEIVWEPPWSKGMMSASDKLQAGEAPIVSLLIAVAGLVGSDEPPPVETGLTETVEVRLVTIDVVALDADDRALPGLTKADFLLYVDGQESPIDTLDVVCSDAPMDDPESKRFGKWTTPPNLAQGKRRIVLAFDYLHLGGLLATQTLRDFQDVFAAKSGIADEEVMVVALTGGLRVEQPFSPDRARLVETLRRMEHDITLWNGNFRHLTERPLFGGLGALMTVLRTLPGSKAVVFVSAWQGSDVYNEPDFRELAARASDAQTAIYSYDAVGLVAFPRVGGARGLARLASSTGGRATRNNNDPTILGCRYTLGFYDREPREGRQHEIRVAAARRGIRVIHAERYSFPTLAERREMSIEAAFLAPQMFSGGGVRAHVFAVAPKDAKHWESLVVVEFPVEIAGGARSETSREFGAVLLRDGNIQHSFDRTITLTATDEPEGSAEHRIAFVEPALVRAGSYTLRTVMTESGSETPHAVETQVVVPEIPRGAPFLVGPTLGRGAGDDVVVFGGGQVEGAAGDRTAGVGDLRPLLVSETGRTTPLAAITQACVVKARRKGPWVVERALLSPEGEPVVSPAGIPFAPEGKDHVVCRQIVDELAMADLPLGRYTFQAILARETRRVPLALVAD